MNSIIETMLERYHPITNNDRENAIKEILQEITLAGLSRSDFFKHAGFYGGTCLRIFYGLNRFSEDLDFALLKKDRSFKIEKYLPYIKKELNSYGIDIAISEKKNNDDAEIKSAFLKENTHTLMMNFFPNNEEAKKVIKNQNITIKIEIDSDNPSGGTTEFKFRYIPSPYEIQVFDEASLFAGKIHAVICRERKKYIKGRDFYDYLFYIGKGSKFNLRYLENKLKNTGGIIKENETLTLEKVKDLLMDRFNSIDFSLAIDDVKNFLNDKESLKLWKKELFISTLEHLSCD